ncbi:uncharacterized protein METZ01_LOCUS106980 [marine metagenome]|uniref:Uncharacterized protein n=1 Tax=marine metagenome TaxID=408172 RepID=A0A381WNM5_9ZZZZ
MASAIVKTQKMIPGSPARTDAILSAP